MAHVRTGAASPGSLLTLGTSLKVVPRVGGLLSNAISVILEGLSSRVSVRDAICRLLSQSVGRGNAKGVHSNGCVGRECSTRLSRIHSLSRGDEG